MANRLYDAAAARFAQAALNWNTITAKVILIDTAFYTVNTATHDFLDDIPAGARVAISPNLASKSSVGGACDANDSTFASVSGAQSEALVIYEDTGTESTSGLIAYIDVAPGLPITPNGGDIIVTWDNGVDKIFKV